LGLEPVAALYLAKTGFCPQTSNTVLYMVIFTYRVPWLLTTAVNSVQSKKLIFLMQTT